MDCIYHISTGCQQLNSCSLSLLDLTSWNTPFRAGTFKKVSSTQWMSYLHCKISWTVEYVAQGICGTSFLELLKKGLYLNMMRTCSAPVHVSMNYVITADWQQMMCSSCS